MPLVIPSQGKPHKGYATFTYNSKIGVITNLDGLFGTIGDKRLPQYMHGSTLNLAVSMSDKRGESGGWGLKPFNALARSFDHLYPGSTPWGLGVGDIVGMPNMMDVSAKNGMIYGEGFPGGDLVFLPTNDKRIRMLAHFLGISQPEERIPRISQETETPCCLWVAKTLAVPSVTRGVIGILCGSSSGIVSAYSIGTPGGRNQRLEKGELTARWLLSPGVPIIKVLADDSYNAERCHQNRIWAVALNALGEVFYLRHCPARAGVVEGPAEHFEEQQEVRAWRTGHTSEWHIVEQSHRMHRPFSPEDRDRPTYLANSVWQRGDSRRTSKAPSIQEYYAWISKSPLEIRGLFARWNMQRKMEVDFAGDDGLGAGENILVIDTETSDITDSGTILTRFTRRGLHIDLASSEATLTEKDDPAAAPTSEWRISNLVTGDLKSFNVTASTLDLSTFALTTASEDLAYKHTRKNEAQSAEQDAFSLDADRHSPLRIPGQRARFVAVGTDEGRVYLWNIRGTGPSTSSITNELTPVRVVHTDSLEISALALTSLYLVHGGDDGLVQVWDPLGSTMSPVRTISSALSGRALRQAQADPVTLIRGLSAIGAICLDPEPGNLRGIVAIRGTLRYWSYSTSSASKASAKKRRNFRAIRGVNSPGLGDGYPSGRRPDLRGVINAQLSARDVDTADELAAAKAHTKLAGRFGVDLLGEDASEEELLAYATMLSQEEEDQRAQKAAEKRLARDASEEDVEKHLMTLSEDDQEKWKFASWEERFEMAASPAATVTNGTPVMKPQQSEDDDLAQALELSLRQASNRSPSLPRASGSSSRSHLADAVDDDTAEAIARSLAQQTSSPYAMSPFSSPSPRPSIQGEDDIERAIRLSLQEAEGQEAKRRGSSFAEDDFPALSSSPRSSPPSRGWGKGKRSAW